MRVRPIRAAVAAHRAGLVRDSARARAGSHLFPASSHHFFEGGGGGGGSSR